MKLAQESTFLIVVSNVLIAEDIAETIRTRWPNARITACRTPEEAVARWPSVTAPRLSAAIADAQPEDLHQSGLHDRIVGFAGCAVLVTSRDDLKSLPGWRILAVPFSEDMLLSALGG